MRHKTFRPQRGQHVFPMLHVTRSTAALGRAEPQVPGRWECSGARPRRAPDAEPGEQRARPGRRPRKALAVAPAPPQPLSRPNFLLHFLRLTTVLLLRYKQSRSQTFFQRSGQFPNAGENRNKEHLPASAPRGASPSQGPRPPSPVLPETGTAVPTGRAGMRLGTALARGHTAPKKQNLI